MTDRQCDCGEMRDKLEKAEAARDALQRESMEVCICAALQLHDGRIIRGHRHDDCIQTMEKWHAAGQVVEIESQGFVTSRNRFVGRRIGAQLQNAAGVNSAHYGRPVTDMLFSEDLY